jgi:DMSO reductase anchor subunit
MKSAIEENYLRNRQALNFAGLAMLLLFPAGFCGVAAVMTSNIPRLGFIAAAIVFFAGSIVSFCFYETRYK